MRRARRGGESEAPRRPTAAACVGWLRLADVGGLQSLGTAGHLELHAIALTERLEAGGLDRAEVHEHVLPAFLRDETEPLGVVEPLHGADGHVAVTFLWAFSPCVHSPQGEVCLVWRQRKNAARTGSRAASHVT